MLGLSNGSWAFLPNGLANEDIRHARGRDSNRRSPGCDEATSPEIGYEFEVASLKQHRQLRAKANEVASLQVLYAARLQFAQGLEVRAFLGILPDISPLRTCAVKQCRRASPYVQLYMILEDGATIAAAPGRLRQNKHTKNSYPRLAGILSCELRV